MKIFISIEQTICGLSNDSKLFPLKDRIERINELYEQGNQIHYWSSNNDNKDFVEIFNRLKSWGCKFHRLSIDKPNYDLFVCDKAINPDDFFNK
jgi:hypothetical protein